MEKLNIERLEDAIGVTKDNKTKVWYYIFDEYEIHYNILPANSIQEWHYHQEIEEVIVVTKGNLKISWLEGKDCLEEVAIKKEVVQVKKSIHTLINDTSEDIEFIVFRLVLDGNNKREIIKNDKVIVDR